MNHSDTMRKTIVLSVIVAIVAIVAIVTMDGLALEQKSVHRVYTPTNTTDGGGTLHRNLMVSRR